MIVYAAVDDAPLARLPARDHLASLPYERMTLAALRLARSDDLAVLVQGGRNRAATPSVPRSIILPLRQRKERTSRFAVSLRPST
jgi:hypothetical protein